MTFPSFAEFFTALNGHAPFPWQERLANVVAAGAWPGAVALPTAAGKTACLDIATWALARQAAEGTTPRTMPRRIVLVVDRRIVVDDAFRRAERIAGQLKSPTDPVLRAAGDALASLGGEIPIHATVLRGGIYRDERWARTPLQPTLVVSTVDQVGSRLLFRGYGLSDGQRPIHAGLLANDTLLVLDEAHLSRPFEETLEWIAHHRRQGEQPIELPFAFVRMTATPPPGTELFEAGDEDRAHPVLGRRIRASKPARLAGAVEAKSLAKALADEASQHAVPGATVAVVVNRVATAREVFRLLREPKRKLDADVILLTGRSRPHERDQVIGKWTERLRSGRDRAASATAKPLVLVATQCIEAGADVDFDYLVTECAPLDALRQRFGRLDRLGELPEAAATPRAAIFSDGKTLKAQEDPVYGTALKATWDWLATQAKGGIVDFGIAALQPPEGDALKPLLSPRESAPLLQRAYCDLLAQTSPEPVPSPDPAAFLHGIQRNDPEVQLVWRADLPDRNLALWADIVSLCPPVAGETLAVRLSVARAWLTERGKDPAPDDADLEGLAPLEDGFTQRPQKKAVEAEAEDGDDAGEEEVDEGPQARDAMRPVLRWVGAEDSRILRDAREIRPGDTLVLPAIYGGCDTFGWDPESLDAVPDIAHEARLNSFRSPVLRLHGGLSLPPSVASFADLKEPPEEGLDSLRDDLDAALDAAKDALPGLIVGLRKDGYRIDLHPADGLVLTGKRPKGSATFSDADDTSSSRGGRVTVAVHNRAVAAKAEGYARDAGLPEAIVAVLRAAGQAHDLGKADPRFQAWLAGGNRLLALREQEPLAKSERAARKPADIARAREASGYPRGGRHELLSTRLLESGAGLPADDALRDLLLHLVASHHGHCRPFAPVIGDPEPVDVSISVDGAELRASSATGLERLDSGVARRYFRLVRRHGWWGLAYLESLLRLADHRVSERDAPEEDQP